jgi:hypothetical protein
MVKEEGIMPEFVPCPNQGCRNGKIHLVVGFDIFWSNCPICRGSGFIVKSVSQTSIENSKMLV